MVRYFTFSKKRPNPTGEDWTNFFRGNWDQTFGLRAVKISEEIVTFTSTHDPKLKASVCNKNGYDLYAIGGGFVLAFHSEERKLLILNTNGMGAQKHAFQWTADNCPSKTADFTATDHEVLAEMQTLFEQGDVPVRYMERRLGELATSIQTSIQNSVAAVYATRAEFNCFKIIFVVMILAYLGILVGLFCHVQKGDNLLADAIGAHSNEIKALQAGTGVQAELNTATAKSLESALATTKALSKKHEQFVESFVTIELKQESMEARIEETANDVKMLRKDLSYVLSKVNNTNSSFIGDGKTEQLQIGSSDRGLSLWTLSLWSMVSMFISFVWNLAIGALVFVAIGASVRAMVMTPEEKKKRQAGKVA
jgi:hypothetical protein